MNTQSRLFQRLGGLGIVFTVLFVLVNVLTGNEPGSNASGASVVRYYHSHQAAATAGVFVTAAAVLAFTFFLASLRRTLSSTSDGRFLASIVTAGGAVYATGLLIMGALTIALVDTAKHGMAGAAQTLNVLSTDDWVPVVVGLSLVALATGIAALRTHSLPRWVAWFSIGLGILAVAGPLGGLAFLVTPLWTLAVGIVLLRGKATDPEPATPSAVPSAPLTVTNR
jgi:hypothetical protein